MNHEKNTSSAEQLATKESSTLAQALLGVAQTTENLTKRGRYLIQRLRGKESRHTSWNGRYFLQLFFNEPALHRPENLNKQLAQDFFSLLDEEFYWRTRWYDYDPFGIERSYAKQMDTYAQNFETAQQEKGRPTTRAQIETAAVKSLIDWMDDPTIPPGAERIWISPRGRKSDGYLGTQLKKPVKVNHYQKTEAGPKFRQFTVWSKNRELRQLQSQLEKIGARRQQLELVGRAPEDARIIACQLNFDPNILQPKELERLLYQNEDRYRWRVKRADLPQFNYAHFDQFRQQIFDRYFATIEPVIFSMLTKHPTYDDFFQSSDLKPTIAFLDNQFAIAFSALKTLIAIQDKQIRHRKHLDLSLDQIAQQALTHTINAEIASSKAYRQQPLTADDRSAMRAAVSFFKIGNQLISLSQCGLMTPFTAPLSAMRSIAMGPHSEMALMQFELQLGLMSLEAKKKTLQDLERLDYQELDLRDQGASQVWMVPADYLKPPGCRVNAEGKVCGPCMTDEFPDGIPLDHPLETLAMPMNQQQFDQYRALIEQEIYHDELQSVAQMIDSDPTASDQDKLQARQLLSRITDLVMDSLKPSISFNEFMVGGVYLDAQKAQSLPQVILQALKSCDSVAELINLLTQQLLTSTDEILPDKGYNSPAWSTPNPKTLPPSPPPSSPELVN